MKNPNVSIIKLQLCALLAIGVAAPCLYAQCITSSSCTSPVDQNGGQCVGTEPLGQQGGGEAADWLAGDSPCGEVYINKADTGSQCGQGIATECA